MIHQYFIHTETKKVTQINDKNTLNNSNIFDVLVQYDVS
jgi:hypothetical protein